MVRIVDGIGRPLYNLDEEGDYKTKFHPHTGEKMPDNFELKHPYPWHALITFLILSVLSIVGIILTCYILHL